MTATTTTTAVVIPRLALTGIDADLRTVLTSTNTALVKARETVPAFRERAHALAQIVALEEQLNARPARTMEQVIGDLLHRFGTGDPVAAADLETAALELATNDTLLTTRRTLMERIKLEASEALGLSVSGHFDAMRSYLHQALTTLVDEVRGDRLHQAADAAAAIASKRIPDHERFNELASDYSVLRGAQLIIDKAHLGAQTTGGASSPTYNVARTMRGASQAWDDYGRWALNGWPTPTESDLYGHAAAHLPPWPDIAGPTRPFLAWLGATDAKAWVPTGRQLEDEMRELAGSRRAEEIRDRDHTMPNRSTADVRPPARRP